ncbi:MAG: PaaI family thioesterase [Gammaproteobacteria bacterium]|nr:PaaI family thioesterase [Gammaproteobacteria bacterium]
MSRGGTRERQAIPAEFTPKSEHSGFATHVGPYHVAEIEGAGDTTEYWIGLRVDERHGGRKGGEFGHGGMLMALLDEIMGRTASRAAGKVCATVSMQTNFCAPFYDGDFLRASANVTRRGRTMVFVDGVVMCADDVIGTASGVWINTGQPLP